MLEAEGRGPGATRDPIGFTWERCGQLLPG